MLDARRKLTAALASIALVALAACGGGEQDGRAVAEAGIPGIENQQGPQDYRDVVRESLALLGEHWTEQLAAAGEDSAPPAALVSYWNRDQDKGCDGEPAGPANAQYCPPTDTISWDGNYVGELYEIAGDAAAFLLAHEYGHLVQDRVGVLNDFELTIEAELNADCLAGAWFGAVDEEIVALTDEDYDALYAGVLDVADPRGVPWQDPQAHGTADERGEVLVFGGEEGPLACFEAYGPGFTR